MDELQFWKSCCSRGIAVCHVPKPIREEARCWLVVKHETFDDRRQWIASHTFDSEHEMVSAILRYLKTGDEPEPRYRDAQPED